MTRRRFLSLLRIGVPLGGASGFAYMYWGEAEWLRVSRHRVPLTRKLTSPIRVLHLSDLHASESVSLEYIERGVDLGLSLQPQLICLTGDYITLKWEDWDRYAAILRKLSDYAPTYGCLGNHDGGHWNRRHGYPTSTLVRQLLDHGGVKLLDNSSSSVSIDGNDLHLVGVNDLWNLEMWPEVAFRDIGTRRADLLLCHNPDAKAKLSQFAWDLMLCGHTHGGQLQLPIIGTPFAPVRDKRYVDGLHEWEGRWIHTTRGVGNLHGMRFNCRPEVSLLEIG